MRNSEWKHPIKELFYVFGFGWSNDNPESVYVIPAEVLYKYDKDSHEIIFPNETVEEKIKRLSSYEAKTKYLMYNLDLFN